MAKRYLFAKKSHQAINIISWISVISVSIGTFALVVVLSAFNGLEGLVESLFESFDSDIKISAKTGKTFSVEDLNWELIDQTPGLINYTKVLEEVCGIQYKNQQGIASFKGVEDSFIQMSKLDSNIVEGSSRLTNGPINFAISGYGIASSLGIFMSNSMENIQVFSPKRGKVNPINPMQSIYHKSISPGGVFYFSPEYDLKYVLVPLRFMQDLLKYENQLSGVELEMEEGVDLESAKKSLSTHLGSNYKIKTRYEFNAIIYKTNKTEKWVTFLILVFILIIAAFNILGSLSMLIIDKQKDIHTLESLGANKSLIKKIFFIEGMLINGTGAVIGLSLGLIVCLLQQHVGLLRLEGGIVDFYPVSVNYFELLGILITVLFIGLLCSWYPVAKLTRGIK